ncbi:Fur-regulated basic protein FbpA [Niallia sp.]|uniref:Fur-regulated basic protein FbpA n=1 Tax=Niallia sp. TaxID=2837523 RepID=UPI0028A062CB|nr:Fur-regulated basic protein FbpA [Niallia sp.]
MSALSHEAIQKRRNYLIDQLLSVGIYKKENVQLYELCLSDLEREYKLFKEGETTSEKENIKTISD